MVPLITQQLPFGLPLNPQPLENFPRTLKQLPASLLVSRLLPFLEEQTISFLGASVLNLVIKGL